MAKRINVKLIMDLSAGGLTQDEIATSRHFSKSSVSLVLKTSKLLDVTAEDLREMTDEEVYHLFFLINSPQIRFISYLITIMYMRNSKRLELRSNSSGKNTVTDVSQRVLFL